MKQQKKKRQAREPPPPATVDALIDLWVHQGIQDARALARRLALPVVTVRALLRRGDIQDAILRLSPRAYLDEQAREARAREDDALARARAERKARMWDRAAGALEELIPGLPPRDLIQTMRALDIGETYRLQRSAAGRDDEDQRVGTAANERFRALLERLTVPAPGEETSDAVRTDGDPVPDDARANARGAGEVQHDPAVPGVGGNPSPVG